MAIFDIHDHQMLTLDGTRRYVADRLDQQIVRALQVNGRAPFSSIGGVLGVSDQTVARRYRRLRKGGLVRVRGLLEPSTVGKTQWLVRISTAAADAGLAVAQAVAQRSDSSWISLTSSQSSVVCIVTTPDDSAGPTSLLHEITTRRDIIGIETDLVKHEFFGGSASLIAKHHLIADTQVEILRPTPTVLRLPVQNPHFADNQLLERLSEDGRLAIRTLAAAASWSQSTVRRRLDHLCQAGLLYFTADYDHTLLGLQTRAILRLRVTRNELQRIGTGLAAHPETAYVAATTGLSNIYCAVWCQTFGALYNFLTETLPALGNIDVLETALVTHRLKTNGLTLP